MNADSKPFSNATAHCRRFLMVHPTMPKCAEVPPALDAIVQAAYSPGLPRTRKGRNDRQYSSATYGP